MENVVLNPDTEGETSQIKGLAIQVKEPEVGQIIIIPSGFAGTYLIIIEFAENEGDISVDRMTKEDVEETFKIEIIT